MLFHGGTVLNFHRHWCGKDTNKGTLALIVSKSVNMGF